MNSRRKPVDTSLFAKTSREETSSSPVQHDSASVSSFGDMSSEDRRVKRASFDIYEDQIERLGMLKYRTRTKISDLVREALDDYLAKHE